MGGNPEPSAIRRSGTDGEVMIAVRTAYIDQIDCDHSEQSIFVDSLIGGKCPLRVTGSRSRWSRRRSAFHPTPPFVANPANGRSRPKFVIGRLLSHSRKQPFAVLLHRQDCARPGRSDTKRGRPKPDVLTHDLAKGRPADDTFRLNLCALAAHASGARPALLDCRRPPYCTTSAHGLDFDRQTGVCTPVPRTLLRLRSPLCRRGRPVIVKQAASCQID